MQIVAIVAIVEYTSELPHRGPELYSVHSDTHQRDNRVRSVKDGNRMDPVTSSDSRAGWQSRLRGRVYALLEAPDYLRQGRAGDRPSSGGSIIPELFLVSVILLNTVSLILWTVPSLTSAYSLWFHLVEYGTVSVFVAEYVLRFWAAPEKNAGASPWQQRWRFVVTPTSLIDAAAILPSLATIVVLLISGDSLSLSFLLVLRLVTRSAKLARYFPGGRRLGMALRLKAGQLLTAVAGLLVVLVIAAALMYFAESASQPEVFSSIPAAMWWSVVTLTTVGYGDTVPVTVIGRLLAAVIAVLGIGLFALPAGILSAAMMEANAADQENGNGAQSAGVCPHCGGDLTTDAAAGARGD